MEIRGWGRYLRADANVLEPRTLKECDFVLSQQRPIIARGLGRSYGDSALAATVIQTRYLDHFLEFNEHTGVLRCASGVSLDEILRTFIPRGWFLPVTPGTKHVTVGGAIAADVHGKNHHIDGSFCQHVREIDLLLGSGELVVASDFQEPLLFRATCGGMGLTGVIISARIQLKRISSTDMLQTTIKAPNLQTVIEEFEANPSAPYSVAWIDGGAKGARLGRSILMLGEHADEGPRKIPSRREITLPFNMPEGLLNNWTMRAFNEAYYASTIRPRVTRRVGLESFFYPLDRLRNWNRLYGDAGLIQYQFVLPKVAGLHGLEAILQEVASSSVGSVLGVLKVFGKGNVNFLSFPREGYTLALDFRATATAIQLLKRLDERVLHFGGRLYLAKDARMSVAMFRASYPLWQEFEQVRTVHHALGSFSSHQSRRIGLQ